MRVLIVEDQKDLSIEIKSFLEKEKMAHCDAAYSYQDASEALAVNTYDFVLLDLGLPDGDGFDLLQEAKEMQEFAIYIIITARGDVPDRVRGLMSGADDYLAKPFSLLELQARMLTILRRKSGWNDAVITFFGFDLDIQQRTVCFEGKEIVLTKKEFDILHYLLIHKNKVINRFQLGEHVWGEFFEDDHQSNFINVHVKNIRKKLGEYASTDWLETIRGIGYKINL